MSPHPSSPAGSQSSIFAARSAPLAFAGLWIAALATLAFLTANPVTLNRAQLLAAPIIVSARVDNAKRGECTIDEHWKGPDARSGSITVQGLPADRMEDDLSYILPLIPKRSGEYEIVPAGKLDESPQLIYPATPEALAQLRRICN